MENDKNTYPSHERLLNFVIFVLMDTMLDAYDDYQETQDAEELTFHDALLEMRSDAKHINVIMDWLNNHKQYVNNPSWIIDSQYYTIVLHGILIEYNYAFKNADVDDYAKQCEEQYLSWN